MNNTIFRFNFRSLFSYSLLCFFTFSLSLCLSAVEIHPNAGTTSASFLKIGAGARAAAMAGAFSAISDDATALYWNPAGLVQLKNPELSVMHNESFESIRYDFAGYARPMLKGTAALAIYGLYTPKDLERRSGLNESDPYEPISSVEGLFQAYDMALHLSYARNIRKNLSVGTSLKLIQQTIDTESAFGAAVDLGSLYHFSNIPLSLALAVQNLGTPIKFRDTGYILPSNIKLGAAYRFNSKFLASAEFNKPVDNFLFASAGAEYSPVNLLALRVGYRYRWSGLELGDLSGLTAGIGFNMMFYDMKLLLDYAFQPYGVLGNSHKISLGVVFGMPYEARPIKKSKPVETAKPELKKEPILPPAPVITSNTAVETINFKFYKAKLTPKLKRASGRYSIYSVLAESSESDIAAIYGFTQNIAVKNIELAIGEKPGIGKVYKYLIFKNTNLGNIYDINCKIRLPKTVLLPSVRLSDNKVVPLEKASETNEHIYYRFHMDYLNSFSVETNK